MQGNKTRFEILDMSQNCVEQVKQIELECGLAPWTKDDYRNEISRENSMALTANYNDTPIGFVVARFTTHSDDQPNEAEIYNIAVRKEFRNLGAGRALLDHFLNRAKEARVEKIWLEVRESNRFAIAFYKKNGFAEAYRRINFYRNPTENCIVMKRELFS